MERPRLFCLGLTARPCRGDAFGLTARWCRGEAPTVSVRGQPLHIDDSLEDAFAPPLQPCPWQSTAPRCPRDADPKVATLGDCVARVVGCAC